VKWGTRKHGDLAFALPGVTFTEQRLSFGHNSATTTSEKGYTMPEYTYSVVWSEEDQEHVGLCFEFPGLSWLEKTPEAALAGIRRIVAESVAEMIEDGEPVPAPRP
jgi:predicted RNase H-like HicB family nuclease